jgi:cyclohexanecarboxylate-CoA ligase
MSLFLNSTMVLVPRWNADTAVDLIHRYQCAYTVAPTPFLVDIVSYAEQNGTEKLSSLRFFPSAGAPVPRPLVKRALAAMPHCEVWSYFGTSEAGAVTAVPRDASLEHRLETDGIALPGIKTRVVDGELQIHGPSQMMLGYWSGDPGKRLKEDGWYATGDEAIQRHDGYIRMLGRARDIILRGGENISPLEIENVLLGHPAVKDVAIVSYPDDRLGARLAAVVVTSDKVTLDDLRTHCEKRGLDKGKWPEFMTEIDKIPLSAIGKVIRGELEEFVLRRRQASAAS